MKVLKNLWTWVIVAFILLIGGWIALGYLAFSNKPETIEVIQSKS